MTNSQVHLVFAVVRKPNPFFVDFRWAEHVYYRDIRDVTNIVLRRDA